MQKGEWNVPDLLQLSGGYWAACALHASVRLDLFSTLGESPLSADAAAAACKADSRAMEMLLNALTSLGLIEKGRSGYGNTAFSAKYLVRCSPDYMGHIIRHHHHLMAGWAVLHEAVITGEPVCRRVSHDADADERESFLMGMYNLASLLAPRVAKGIDLKGCRRLLDLGGGPGTYAIHFCRQNPDLTAVVFDLPTSHSFAESTIARYGLNERISFSPGDYNVDALPGVFDLAWLSHILHSEGPDACRRILRKAVAALAPGGRLLVQEFIMNNSKDGPQFPALFSLNMLLGTAFGQSYSEIELQGMMEDAGLSDVGRIAIDLPNGAGIMSGRVA